MEVIHVVGAGLAGSEAAYQIARRGVRVRLHEMKPLSFSPAHREEYCAELVCSNSFGSTLPDRASGLLQEEIGMLGSLLLSCARETRVSAGTALAVDRREFSLRVTRVLEECPRVEILREEVVDFPEGVTVVATGPLTSERFSRVLAAVSGEDFLHFYDAMAPIVEASSLNMEICYRASRWGRGESKEGDYINCPMSREQYMAFVRELAAARTIPLREFEREKRKFFEACVPVEELARRGEDTLAYGPLRPVGLEDPRTGKRPYAVVQLRKDDVAGSLYNMVGFQTNLTYGEQKRVFRMIPGMEHAEFVRYGQMHRNTYLNAPTVLSPSLMMRKRRGTFVAGQLSGVEGYLASIATGLVAGINAVRMLRGMELLVFPRDTMIGALIHYICHARPAGFQPMKANFGILPPLGFPVKERRKRNALLCRRARERLQRFLEEEKP